MFGPAAPEVALFYTGVLDDHGKVPGPFYPYTINVAFGRWAANRERPAAGLRVVLDTGTLRSPAMTLSTMSRNGHRVSAALVTPRNALDSNDVEVDWDTMGALNTALVKDGGTFVLTENGRTLASFRLAPGDASAGRDAALAFGAKAYPWLKQGKCPD
jgi:hypothetical protein